MASHPILLPDALKWNLQVTLVAIIKTVLLWRCVQSVLSPDSDRFKVAEGKRDSREEKWRERGSLKKCREKINVVSGYLLKCMNIPYVIKCSCELEVKTTT